MFGRRGRRPYRHVWGGRHGAAGLQSGRSAQNGFIFRFLYEAGKAAFTTMIWRVTIPTSLAIFTALLTQEGVRQILYQPPVRRVRRKRLITDCRLPPEVRRTAVKLAVWLRGYAAGRKPRCRIPLDLKGHSEFRRRVWRCLQQVPCGSTITYGQLAQKAGSRSARAVGG
ncbi:MAG: MGMT family protein, partial [Planctomycetota bacterium]|nr:MGMT family protein [Planctomycetota bacterium]